MTTNTTSFPGSLPGCDKEGPLHDVSIEESPNDEESARADFSTIWKQDERDPDEIVVQNNKSWRRSWVLAAAVAVVVFVAVVVAGVCGDGSCGSGGPGPSDSGGEVSFSSKEGLPPASDQCSLDFNVVCTVPGTSTVPDQPCEQFTLPTIDLQTCMFRPSAATMLYNGGGCGQSDNMDELNFSCRDSFLGPPTNEGSESYIVVTDNDGAGPVLFEGIVAVGELFSLSNNGVRFGDVQKIMIKSLDQRVIQQEVHLSLTCSHPLELFNRFGASQVVEYYNDEQGLITGFATFSTEVNIQLLVTGDVTNPDEEFVLTNLWAGAGGLFPMTDISHVLVIGDDFGLEAPFEITLEGIVDGSAPGSYTIDFSYSGLSTVGNETTACDGEASTDFVFGSADGEGN